MKLNKVQGSEVYGVNFVAVDMNYMYGSEQVELDIYTFLAGEGMKYAFHIPGEDEYTFFTASEELRDQLTSKTGKELLESLGDSYTDVTP